MGHTHTVLLVEDNAITRRLARHALETNGFRVVEAVDGVSALSSFVTEPISLVLQDLCLPDLDGYELVARLRQLPRGEQVPIIAFSGLISADDEGRLSAAGFDDQISKPVEPSRLASIVRAHLPEPLELSRVGARRRIIVADDDAVQRRLATIRLERLGFQVAAVSDGAQALAEARREVPHAVLSDVLMPQLDGFGLCVELRKDPALAHVPLVLTTSSYVEPADRAFALKAGAHGYVHRTPELKEVVEALSHALENAEAARVVTPDDELEREHQQRMMRQLERQVTLNARATQRAASLSAELAVLKRISEALASQTSVDDAVHQALSTCFDASGVSLGALFLKDNGKRRVIPFGFSRGDGEAVLADFWGEPQLLDQVMESHGTLVLGRDADGEGKRVLAKAGVGSGLLVPVHHERLGSGALLMMSRNAALENEERIAFAEALAAQLSQALAVARTFTQRDRDVRQPLSILATGVAEQLDTPLAAIEANLALLRAHFPSAELEGSPRPLVDEASHALEKARSVLSELKLLARPGDEAPGVIDVRRLLDATARLVWPEVRQRAQLLKEYDGPTQVRGVESRLAQAFLTLAMNAVHALVDGKLTVDAVTLRTCAHAKGLAIEIADSGAALTPQRQLSHPLVERLIASSGGSLEVEPRPARGTVVRVVLPVEAARSRLLVVDDEDLVGRMVRRVLSARYDVSVARSVDEALAVLERGETFELILSDLMMPGKTGIELFHAIAAKWPGLEQRVVFMTGGAFTPAGRAFLDSVPNRSLVKPFMPDELNRAVAEAIAALS